MAPSASGLLLKDMSESDLVDTILEYAKTGGWMRVHFRPARTNKGWRTLLQGDKGYPDLTLAHKDLQRLIVAECKTERGSLSPEQRRWREALEAIPGIEYYLWKPTDLPSIRQAILGHRTQRQAQWG